MAIRESEIRKHRRELIARTARIWTRLYKELKGELRPIVHKWLKSVNQQIYSGVIELPELPPKFHEVLSKVLREAMAQGYWLSHVYIQEVKASANKRKYRGRITLADNLNDDEIREGLLNFIAGDSEWHDVMPEAAVKWLEGYVVTLGSGLSRSVEEKATSVIRQSMLEGATLQERMRALRDAAPELEKLADNRIEAIARTEVTRADSMGRLISSYGDDDVLGYEFSAIMDDRTTDICASRHGLVMAKDDPRLAENTPPQHVNCRSVLLSLMIYDYPDGLLTSHEFDEVPASMQRPEDVEAVQELLSSLSMQEKLSEVVVNAGALDEGKKDPDEKRRIAHAFRFYETRRNSEEIPQIQKIAVNAGVPLLTAKKAFEHVFIKKYDLGDGVLEHFYPSYDMAESFRRLLQNDDIQEHDIILIHHERLEYELMNRYGKSSEEAHALTNLKYNYSLALKRWKEARGVLWNI